MRPRRNRPALAVAALVVLGLAVWLTPAQASRGALPGSAAAPAPVSAAAPLPRPSYVPRIRHVFVINIENKGYDETFGAGSASPYLAGKLRRMGVLLNSYYGTAHNSLPNYLAQISGQAPTLAEQLDCQVFAPFTPTGPDQEPGQKVGAGCVYPADVDTLPMQLTRSGLTWRGYMQQMSRPCQHPALGKPDPTQHARKGHNYAVRHDPFVYFRAITANATFCARHVKPLTTLLRDLAHARTTRNLTYITPDLCRDGHDAPCANGAKGGLSRVDRFLKRWAPRILASPAFKRNGMLVITADESDSPVEDSSACCDETSGPNVLNAGIIGPGGGKVGALVISPFTLRNSWSTTPYNHYSLLASLEEIFGQPKLGMASVTGLPVFGLDVYNNGWWNR
jgi:phosphatidylinositol-3-phosphatase